jgi:hypothetical protein
MGKQVGGAIVDGDRAPKGLLRKATAAEGDRL